MTTKKLHERHMKVAWPVTRYIHLPHAYPFGRKFYGLTAGMTPTVIFSPPNSGPVVAFDVALAFCSPTEPRGYRGEKGCREVVKRRAKGGIMHLLVPLDDILRGKLEQALLDMIDQVLGPSLVPDGLLELANKYGFPTRLLYYRHAHRNDSRRVAR